MAKNFVVVLLTALVLTSASCGTEPPTSPGPPVVPIVVPNTTVRPDPPSDVSYLEPDLLPNGDPNPKATGPIPLMAQDAAGNWTVNTSLTVKWKMIKPWPGSQTLTGNSNGPDPCRDNYGAGPPAGCFEYICEICAFPPGPREEYSGVQFYLSEFPNEFKATGYVGGGNYREPGTSGGGCLTLNMTNTPTGGGARLFRSEKDLFLQGKATLATFAINGSATEIELRTKPLYVGYRR